MRSLILILVLLAFAESAYSAKGAKTSIPNFDAGKYQLIEGEDSKCGDGTFYISEDGKSLRLGPYYGFSTTPEDITSLAIRPDEKDCKNQTITSIKTESRKTILTIKDTLSCASSKGKEYVIDEVTISRNRVALQQTRTADPERADKLGGSNHSCVWKKVKK